MRRRSHLAHSKATFTARRCLIKIPAITATKCIRRNSCVWSVATTYPHPRSASIRTRSCIRASVLIDSEPKLQILVLTRFLHANRYPLRSKTLWTFRSVVSAGQSVRVRIPAGRRSGGGCGARVRLQTGQDRAAPRVRAPQALRSWWHPKRAGALAGVPGARPSGRARPAYGWLPSATGDGFRPSYPRPRSGFPASSPR
jgi:hypothetical protein